MTELETMLLQSLEQLNSEAQEREARSIGLLNDLSMKCSELTKQVQTLTAAQQDYRSLEVTCKELADRLEKSAREYSQQQLEINELQRCLVNLQREATRQEQQSRLTSSTTQTLLDSIRKSSGS
jgi:chromosome segregation ATPase